MERKEIVWGPAGWLVLLEDIKAITFFELQKYGGWNLARDGAWGHVR